MTQPPVFKGPADVVCDILGTMIWLLTILILCANAEDLTTKPGVQHLKVSAVSPWAIFVSWKKPATVENDAIKEYLLSGSITEKRNPGDDWVFCFVDKNLRPGSNVSVTMTVVYQTQGNSTPETINATMPEASK